MREQVGMIWAGLAAVGILGAFVLLSMNLLGFFH